MLKMVSSSSNGPLASTETNPWKEASVRASRLFLEILLLKSVRRDISSLTGVQQKITSVYSSSCTIGTSLTVIVNLSSVSSCTSWLGPPPPSHSYRHQHNKLFHSFTSITAEVWEETFRADAKICSNIQGC